MPTLSFIAITLLVTVVVGGISSFLIRRHQRRKFECQAGLAGLAAMRWREYSRFIVEGLEERGFRRGREQPDLSRGQDAHLLLLRGGHTWLLACRQGLDSQTGPELVERMSRAIRMSEARGGVIATLGRFAPAARKVDPGVELLDGPAVWKLVQPVLPASLLEDVRATARKEIRSRGVLAWLVAVLLGMGLAWLLTPHLASDPAPSVAPPTGATPDTRRDTEAPGTAPPPMAPDLLRPVELSEEEQRGRVLDELAELPDVQHAGWATRSTLVVRLERAADDALVDSVCDILLPHPDVRDQRIQLQPPEGEGRVRFLQCAPY